MPSLLTRLQTHVSQLDVPLLGSFQQRRALWFIFFWVASAAIFASSFIPHQVSLAVGQAAPYTIKAPRDFIDQPTTRALQAKAALSVPDVYDQDQTVNQEVAASLGNAFAAIDRVRSQTGQAADKLAALRKAIDLKVPDIAYEAVLKADEGTLKSIESEVEDLVGRQLNKGIKQSTLDTFRQDTMDTVQNWNYSPSLRTFFAPLAANSLKPNFFLDETKTAEQRRLAKDAVQPVVIVKGEAIVREGQKVSADDLTRLRDAGLLKEKGNVRLLLGAALLALITLGLVTFYIYQFRRPFLERESRLALIGLVYLGILLASRMVVTLTGYTAGYLAPVAWGAMLVTILLDASVASVCVIAWSLGLAFLTGHDVRTLFVAMVGGMVGVYSVNRLAQRSDIMRGGFLVAGANALAILTLGLIYGGDSLQASSLWFDLGLGVGNGVFAGMLTLGSIPYLEGSFGLLTAVRLLELSNANQPLLRRLLVEAPGTWHHTLMVSNMAEAASEAVGGDPLLTRVGAYYHDIGKMKRPYFFIDNQFGGENPHEKLSPNLSALIIISHVKDGLEMARAHGLPEEIAAFIAEHHGTQLVSFFYQKAKDEGGDVAEENFRYPGPLPRTKETAIVMLADGCEASVRALKEPTPDRIEAQVRKIVKDRLETGQLEQCDLTLKDLDEVVRAFVRVLSGIHHQRIQYPDQILEDMKRGQSRVRGREQRRLLGRGS